MNPSNSLQHPINKHSLSSILYIFALFTLFLLSFPPLNSTSRSYFTIIQRFTITHCKEAYSCCSCQNFHQSKQHAQLIKLHTQWCKTAKNFECHAEHHQSRYHCLMFKFKKWFLQLQNDHCVFYYCFWIV